MNEKLENALSRIVKDTADLSKVCLPCEEFDGEYIIKCEIDLIDTARILDRGKTKCAGLASNQLGYNCRMFVIKNGRGRFVVYFDPIIVAASPVTKTSREGCFSRPGTTKAVTRHVSVRVRRGERGKEHVLTGIEAIAFQHELDHLNGVLV